MNAPIETTLILRDPHPLDGRDAAVQVGHTDDGHVAVILDRRAAETLAQLVAHRTPTTPPEATLEAERDPDDDTWCHVVVDLLVSAVTPPILDGSHLRLCSTAVPPRLTSAGTWPVAAGGEVL